MKAAGKTFKSQFVNNNNLVTIANLRANQFCDVKNTFLSKLNKK